MPWKIFVVEPSPWCRRAFRRYVSGSSCSAGYHDAKVFVDPRLPEVDFPACGLLPTDAQKADPRWPRTCACGYAFAPEDEWQVKVDRLYSGCPDGELRILRDLPIGALWDASWLADTEDGRARYAGPDGKAWCVMLPGQNDWLVYGPSKDGKKWEITGLPPNITAVPSIGAPTYHGHIQGGVITEDVEGRKFEGVLRTA